MGMFGAQSVMLTGRCARAFGGRRLAAQESAGLGVFGRGIVLVCPLCESWESLLLQWERKGGCTRRKRSLRTSPLV